MAEWSVNKNSVLAYSQLATLGHLELANITAESLNFWLISKFTG